MRLRGKVRSVRSLRTRLRSYEAAFEEAVDAGWADGLLTALVEIADGKAPAQDIARAALVKAGVPTYVRPVQQRISL